MKKMSFFLVILFVGLLSSTSYAGALGTSKEPYLEQAEALKTIGLFQGTENGFELSRIPTRLEGAAMLVRLLGKQSQAEEAKYVHPFKDVPTWGNVIVGYMYHEKLTSGKTSDKFGASDTLTSSQYATFILRSLGYSDVDGDFSWDKSLEKLEMLKIITDTEKTALSKAEFNRGLMVLLSYNAMNAKLKNSDSILLNRLISDGVIFQNNARKSGLLIENPTLFQGGVKIIRADLGTIHSIIDKDELLEPVKSFTHVVTLTYDNEANAQADLQKMNENRFDFSTHFNKKEVTEDDANYNTTLHEGRVIPLGTSYSYSDGDPQKDYYAIVVLYNGLNKQPLGYQMIKVPPYSPDKANSTTMKPVKPESQITSGIELKRVSTTMKAGAKLTITPEKLPDWLRSRKFYYIGWAFSDKPLDIKLNGISSALFSENKYFTWEKGFSTEFGTASNTPLSPSDFKKLDYIGIALLDEEKNVIAFYETYLPQ